MGKPRALQLESDITNAHCVLVVVHANGLYEDDTSAGSLDEYFTTSVGPIKRVELSYGPNSVSRGIATVTFHKPDGASKAFNVLNGILVDNRPIKIEIIVSAAKAAEIIPAPKTLTERITQPKAQPKSAANDKKKDAGKANENTGGVAANVNGDAAMDDEISSLVSGLMTTRYRLRDGDQPKMKSWVSAALN
ncbi:hypothetical protein O1611_g9582 [Lasiodiplodia mahajangana]|uniref:Uncharacterized protein n=1 Tax=Lasiodiplodia mahajangana TaxID=1108764 RepID=A0ACC2J846_9PEZI|nr:hypothetical protein O1611_g9582 [Lasiodiplodia mahajangana]